VGDEERYRGRALADLVIIDIEWSEWSARHLQSRTTRYPDNPDEMNLEPEWATEAALDPFGRLSVSKEQLRVLGLSPSAPPAADSTRRGRVLRVILKARDMDDGYWTGVTAMPASTAASQYYWRRRGSFGAP
jgi:hypothetical protein